MLVESPDLLLWSYLLGSSRDRVSLSEDISVLEPVKPSLIFPWSFPPSESLLISDRWRVSPTLWKEKKP